MGKEAEDHDCPFSSAGTPQKLLWHLSAYFDLLLFCLGAFNRSSQCRQYWLWKMLFSPGISLQGLRGVPRLSWSEQGGSPHPQRNVSTGHESANIRPQVQRAKDTREFLPAFRNDGFRHISLSLRLVSRSGFPSPQSSQPWGPGSRLRRARDPLPPAQHFPPSARGLYL